ncbi:MAG: hypothetical protein AB7S26_02300 [Sandaracinaceae bacterium]
MRAGTPGALFVIVAVASMAPAIVRAQPDDLAVVVSGAGASPAGVELYRILPVPDSRRFDSAPDALPDDVQLLLLIDTDSPRLAVWRRRDDVMLVRPLEGEVGQDAYALAVMAGELVEIARTERDPRASGLRVVSATGGRLEAVRASSDRVDASVDPRSDAPPDAVADPERRAADGTDDPADASGSEPAGTGDAQSPPPAGSVSVTVGLGLDAWLSPTSEGPWQVQPALMFDVLVRAGGAGWLVGGGILVAGLGGWGSSQGGVEATYGRHDFGARFTVGGEVGDARTRLLGHLGGGASLLVLRGEREGGGDHAEVLRPSGFAGLAFEVRQPVVDGFELWLSGGADLLLPPVELTADGALVTREPPVRLGARIGVDWRFE